MILGIKLLDKTTLKGFVDITEERIPIFRGVLLTQQEEYHSLEKSSSLECHLNKVLDF